MFNYGSTRRISVRRQRVSSGVPQANKFYEEVAETKVVGVNLSGKKLTGIDIPAPLLVKQVEAFW